MSKLAHSNEETMDAIERKRIDDEMTDTKPTLDELIKLFICTRGIILDSNSHAAILASLEELKRIQSAEMPMEPAAPMCCDKVSPWTEMCCGHPSVDIVAWIAYANALKAYAKRKDAEAREAISYAEGETFERFRQQKRAESLEQEKAALVAENEGLRKDAERIDWIEKKIRETASVWFCPCGEDLRFVQVRHIGGGVYNHPTVSGLRAAIDNAMAGREG